MLVQLVFAQSWKVTVPGLPAESEKVAASVGACAVRVPPAIPLAAGTAGAVVSSRKLRTVDHADAFPATSWLRTRT